MQIATQGLPVTNFPVAPGLVRVTIDNKTGLLPSAGTPASELENDLFVQGTQPTQMDIATEGITTDNGMGITTDGITSQTSGGG
jgi:membrane carboxypeptidase/penicillin-binding protein